MASKFDNSLFEYDAGYYEYMPGRWLPGKLVPNGSFTFTPKSIEAATSLDVVDTDVLSATFPKTGQTWTLAIIGLIMGHKDIVAGKEVKCMDYSQRNPFIEVELPNGETGSDEFNRLQPPHRVMKTHLPVELFKDQFHRHPNLKVIQNTRNPKDTLVSAYHHMKKAANLGCFTGTWDQFFDFIIQGKGPFGDLFEVTAAWYKFNRDRENSLFLKYEDLLKDHRGHVVKIAKFLGYDLPDDVIDVIVEKTTKQAMGPEVDAKLSLYFKQTQKPHASIRKGGVGDWVNFFTKEQSDLVDAKCKQHFEPLGLTYEYSA